MLHQHPLPLSSSNQRWRSNRWSILPLHRAGGSSANRMTDMECRPRTRSRLDESHCMAVAAPISLHAPLAAAEKAVVRQSQRMVAAAPGVRLALELKRTRSRGALEQSSAPPTPVHAFGQPEVRHNIVRAVRRQGSSMAPYERRPHIPKAPRRIPFAGVSPKDIAAALASMSTDERAAAFRTMSSEDSAAALAAMSQVEADGCVDSSALVRQL